MKSVLKDSHFTLYDVVQLKQLLMLALHIKKSKHSDSGKDRLYSAMLTKVLLKGYLSLPKRQDPLPFID